MYIKSAYFVDRLIMNIICISYLRFMVPSRFLHTHYDRGINQW